jgi:hypothetical protein
MIPEVDIWRVANLMFTRYGDEAMLEGAQRAHKLAAVVTAPGRQLGFGSLMRLAYTTPAGPVN